MKKYEIRINTVAFGVNASNRATAIRRALNGYYHDETASSEARKHRKRDEMGKTICVRITRVE